jgi:hypothetical protein
MAGKRVLEPLPKQLKRRRYGGCNSGIRVRKALSQKFVWRMIQVKTRYRHAGKILVMLLWLVAAGQLALAAPLELSLEDSIALALKNNQTVKIADCGRN